MRRRALVTVLTVGATLAVVATTPPASAAPAPLQPVARVDLARYVGGWYQVAAIPAIYEVQCARNSRAQYAANPDGTVAVHNTCTTWWGSASAVDGTARVDNAPRNSALTVSFLSLGGHPVYGDTSNYLVAAIDRNYRWALVGDPDRVSGFVLSRTPAVSAATERAVRAAIAANGYDVCRFHVTPQDGGSSESGPLC